MATATETNQKQEAYIPIALVTLIPNTVVGAALYICQNDVMRLYRSPHVPIEDVHLDRLLTMGHSKAYVRVSEHSRYQEYLREHLNETLEDETVPVKRRFACLNEVVRCVLSGQFNEGDVEKTVDSCQQLSGQTVDLILREDAFEKDMLRVMHHDYHTFTHSANVSYYCTMLASMLKIGSAEDLKRIATGALLHDLGKLQISDKILCKPGRLTDEEFDVIRQHPKSGFQQLCRREDLDFGQLMMVYQHHERLDGKGYPVGVTADEIHPWAQVCAIADVFEALTSNRPYRSRLTRAQAFEIMERDSGLAFDREMLKCWKMNIQSVSKSC